jgi:hypothetical protein
MQAPVGSTAEQRRQIVIDTLDYKVMPVPVGLVCEVEGCPGHSFMPNTFPIEDYTSECGYELVNWIEV